MINYSRLVFLIFISIFLRGSFYAQQTSPDTAAQSDPLINHCISLVNDVETKGNIIGQLNLDSLGQLPLGIAKDVGGSQVIIAIDSASFYFNKASFNAYAAIDFPGSADKIAFRAQNIEFNPKGIIGGDLARLILVSNHRIRINPNVTLVLKAYDNNYIKWNCSGFEKIHLKGYFELQELLPNANIIHVTDEVPSYPYEHPDFWNIWIALLKRVIDQETEVFFSSEDYGDEVAERLGIVHVMIDKGRNEVPVSGTAIRDFPFDHWDFIPDKVKPYFVKRIVLTGPESTGKTAMAKKLAEHFSTVWVEEYGREYFVKKDGHLILDDILKIAEGQLLLEDKAVLKANKLLFCDTDLIVTQIWSEIYFEECPSKVIDLSLQRSYELYLLMDIDIPWGDDGTREFPHLREWHFNRIKTELEKRGLPYKIISGNFDERFESAKKMIENIYLDFKEP